MKRQSSINNGIQARSVEASALAVGKNAHATAAMGDPEAALDSLSDAIRRLQLDPERQQSILNAVNSMKNGGSPQRVSAFEKIASILKDVGKAAELVAPLRGVAASFGLTIPGL